MSCKRNILPDCVPGGILILTFPSSVGTSTCVPIDASAKLKMYDDEFRIVHWVLANWRVANVKRDYKWLQTHIGDLKSVWDEILTHRANGTLPEKAEKITEALSCEPQIVQHDVQLHPPVVVNPDPKLVDCSSSVHKKNAKTLQFDLG